MPSSTVPSADLVPLAMTMAGVSRVRSEARHEDLRIEGALLGLALAGCASTSLTAYQDPAFATAGFGKVAVLAMGVQLDERIALENQLVGALRNKRVTADSTVQLFPPTRPMSDEELSAALLSSGYDAVLYVQRVEAGSKVEPSWTQMLGGDAANNTAEHLYASFETRLIDLRSSQVAWMASARTGGSEYAGNDLILDSFANRTADELEGGQFLAQRAPLQR